MDGSIPRKMDGTPHHVVVHDVMCIVHFMAKRLIHKKILKIKNER